MSAGKGRGMARRTKRAIPFAVLVVLSFFAIRAVAGEPIQAFVNGMYVGFTDDI